MMHFLLLASLITVEVIINTLEKSKSIKNPRYKKVLYMGILLFLFAALRDSTVGIDVPGYCELFYKVQNYSFTEIFIWKEDRDPIFTCFVKLLTYVYNNHQILLIVVGAMVAFGFSFFVYHQRGSVLMHYILFIAFRMFAFTLTGLRQAMALSFCWIAIVCLQQNKKRLFALFTLLATLFHLSASILFVALLLKYIKKIDFFTFIVLCATIIDLISGHQIIIGITRLLGDRFLSYLEESEIVGYSAGGTFYIYMLFFAVLIWGFCIQKVDLLQDDNAKLLFKMAVVAMALSIMCQNVPTMFRTSYYFMVPFYSLIAPTVDRAFIPKDASIIKKLCIVLLCAQYLILMPGAGINNYVFFWS